jgi:hypothetical protein
MGLRSLIKSYFSPQIVPDYNFYPVNMGFDGHFVSDVRKAYTLCPPVSTTINKGARMFTNAKFYLQKTSESKKRIENHPLLDLLNDPNPVQSRDEFLMNYYIFLKLYGYANLYKFQPSSAINLSDLFVLDPEKLSLPLQMSNLSFKKATWQRLFEGMDFHYSDGEIQIKESIENLIPFFDLYNDTPFSGISRIKQNELSISNIIKALEGENIIISRPGGIGIIKTNANVNNVPSDLDIQATEEKFKQRYGLNFNKSHIVFSKSDLEYINLLQPISNFGFSEVYSRNEDTIMNAFGMSKDVYGKGEVKYENKIQGERSHYQNEVIPVANSFCQGLTQSYELQGIELKADYSHLECFAENKEQKATTMLKVVTSAEKLKNMGYSDEKINEILIDFKIISE